MPLCKALLHPKLDSFLPRVHCIRARKKVKPQLYCHSPLTPYRAEPEVTAGPSQKHRDTSTPGFWSLSDNQDAWYSFPVCVSERASSSVLYNNTSLPSACAPRVEAAALVQQYSRFVPPARSSLRAGGLPAARGQRLTPGPLFCWRMGT